MSFSYECTKKWSVTTLLQCRTIFHSSELLQSGSWYIM